MSADALRWKQLCLKRLQIKSEAMIVLPRVKEEIAKNGGKDIPRFIIQNLEDLHSKFTELTIEIDRLQTKLDKQVVKRFETNISRCGPEDMERRHRLEQQLNRFLELK